MADVEKILRLVAEGALTAEEADEILSALGGESAGEPAAPDGATAPGEPAAPEAPRGAARHLRVEVSEHGRQVVNLRVPLNVAGWASAILPGLSRDQSELIRGAVASGERGPLLDVTDSDGSRVLIVSE